MISVLIGRIDVLIKVIERFKEVDDPYILERLFAVAYGCIIAEKNETQIKSFSSNLPMKIYLVIEMFIPIFY